MKSSNRLFLMLCAGLLVSAAVQPVLAQSVEGLKERLAVYDTGGEPSALEAVDHLVRTEPADSETLRELERVMTALLTEDVSPALKLFLCRHLAYLGSPSALPALGALLKEADGGDAALVALSGMEGEGVNALLRRSLPEMKGARKRTLIELLGRRGGTADADALIPVLSDPEAGPAAATALGSIASPQAVQALLKAYPAAPEDQRVVYAEALLRAGRRLTERGDRAAAVGVYAALADTALPFHLRRAAFLGQARSAGTGRVSMLLEVIGDEQAALRAVALEELRRGTSAGEVEALVKQVPNANPAARAALYDVLAALPGPCVRQLLEQAAGHEADPAAHLAALRALGQRGDPESSKVLLEALAKPRSETAREAAAVALVNLSGENVDTWLTAALERLEDTGDRQLVIDILRRRYAVSAAPALVALAGDPARPEAVAALVALRHLAGSGDLPGLIALAERYAGGDARNLQAALVRAARDGHPVEARKALVRACGADAEAEVVVLFLSVLGGLGEAGGLERVGEALVDSRPAVHQAAFDVLTRWPSDDALPMLLDVACGAGPDRERIRAVQAWKRLAGKVPTETLAATRKRLAEADAPARALTLLDP